MIEKKYELASSNNKKYVVGICKKNIINEMYEMKIWCGKDMREISTLFVSVDLGGARYAISNDCRYVATAKYEDYEKSTIYVYGVETGNIVFESRSLRRVQWLMFVDSETLLVGSENSGIFVYNIISGVCKDTIKGKRFYYNKFSENILLLEKNKIKYNNIIYKSSTFSFLSATGTPEGLLVSEVNGDLIYYNDNGNLRWKTDCQELGHFIDVHYDEGKNKIYGVLLNPRKKGNERMHILILNGETGTIVGVNSVETASYAFVDNSECVLLVNGNGGIYTFRNNSVENLSGRFLC